MHSVSDNVYVVFGPLHMTITAVLAVHCNLVTCIQIIPEIAITKS